MIDAARLGVGRDELVREMRDGFHGGKLTRCRQDTKILSSAARQTSAGSVMKQLGSCDVGMAIR
jgi:hypothetical protein